MAGFVLSADQFGAVAQDLDAICLPYRKPGRKLHATDLGAEAQPLRAALYDYHFTRRIPVVYEAVHAHGFYDFHQMNLAVGVESLHEEIALGIFTKAIAHAAETGNEHHIRIITDRVDRPIMDGFFRAFEAFLDDDPVVEVKTRAHRDSAGP